MMGSALVFLLSMVMTAESYTVARAETEARVARQELEAAQSKSFYLVVDVWQRTAILKVRGMELRPFALQAVELGTQYLGSRAETDWAESVCDFERAIPLMRREMKPTTAEELEKMLLTAEEDHPVPGCFDVDCVSDLSIRFVSETHRGLWAWLSDRMGRRESPRPLRLRIQMNEDDYRDLYEVMPDQGKLLLALPLDTGHQP